MRSTRKLTIDDAQQIVDLYLYVKQFNYRTVPEEKYIWFTDINNVIKSLTQNEENDIYIGTFDNGELIASIKMTFWNILPHWTLDTLITKIHTLTFNMDKNGLADCTKLALDIAESRGRYRFYTAISQRQVIQELFDKWPKYIPELQDYLFVIEAEVDANELSKFVVFEHMFQHARKQDPTLKYYIRSATANNNRRKFKILGDHNGY